MKSPESDNKSFWVHNIPEAGLSYYDVRRYDRGSIAQTEWNEIYSVIGSAGYGFYNAGYGWDKRLGCSAANIALDKPVSSEDWERFLTEHDLVLHKSDGFELHFV